VHSRAHGKSTPSWGTQDVWGTDQCRISLKNGKESAALPTGASHHQTGR
jgi:hypothetical protein